MHDVTTILRIRPPIRREATVGTPNVLQTLNDGQVRVRKRPPTIASKGAAHGTQMLTPPSTPEPERDTGMVSRWYRFDAIVSIPELESDAVGQERLYSSGPKCLVEDLVSGHDACLMVHGQAGSGKTFTLFGDSNTPGLVRLMLQDTFKHAPASALIDISCFLLRNERIVDVLQQERHNLRVREHPVRGPYVEGLSSKTIQTVDQGIQLLTQCRSPESNKSPFHTILVITLRTSSGSESRLTVVDLANKSKSASAMASLGHVNQSLTALGTVIASLTKSCRRTPSQHRWSAADCDKQIHIPYRNSALTWLLKDSLSGKTRLCFIATASPSSLNFSETLYTLRYAERIKYLDRNSHNNVDSKVLQALRRQVVSLRSRLEEAHEKDQSIVEDLQVAEDELASCLHGDIKDSSLGLRRCKSDFIGNFKPAVKLPSNPNQRMASKATWRNLIRQWRLGYQKRILVQQLESAQSLVKFANIMSQELDYPMSFQLIVHEDHSAHDHFTGPILGVYGQNTSIRRNAVFSVPEFQNFVDRLHYDYTSFERCGQENRYDVPWPIGQSYLVGAFANMGVPIAETAGTISASSVIVGWPMCQPMGTITGTFTYSSSTKEFKLHRFDIETTFPIKSCSGEFSLGTGGAFPFIFEKDRPFRRRRLMVESSVHLDGRQVRAILVQLDLKLSMDLQTAVCSNVLPLNNSRFSNPRRLKSARSMHSLASARSSLPRMRLGPSRHGEHQDIAVRVSLLELQEDGSYACVQVESPAKSGLFDGTFVLSNAAKRLVRIDVSHIAGSMIRPADIGDLSLRPVQPQLVSSDTNSLVPPNLITQADCMRQEKQEAPNGKWFLRAECPWTDDNPLLWDRQLDPNCGFLELSLSFEIRLQPKSQRLSSAAFNTTRCMQMIRVMKRPPIDSPWKRFSYRLTKWIAPVQPTIKHALWQIHRIKCATPTLRRPNSLSNMKTQVELSKAPGLAYIRGEECLTGNSVNGMELIRKYFASLKKGEFQREVARTRQVLFALAALEGVPACKETKDTEALLRRCLHLWQSKPQARPTLKHVRSIQLPERITMPNQAALMNPSPRVSMRGWVNLLYEEVATSTWTRKWVVIQRPYLMICDDEDEADIRAIASLERCRLSFNKEVCERVQRHHVCNIEWEVSSLFLQLESPTELQTWIEALDPLLVSSLQCKHGADICAK